MGDSVRLVKPVDRTEPPGASTPGVNRRQAFADDEHWVGYATTEPGVWSGWHHHGEHDTYIYVVRGSIALEFGPGGERRASAEPGDFLHVPPGVVHREGTPPGEPGEVVVVRVGRGTVVVPVEGPEPA
jgi:uncharacterized RmlC-like cupin family protein